jgi:ABC-type branched-subunit amino acid transport system permease subunit
LFVHSRYALQLGNLIMVYIVVALGQNIVLGISGQITLAQSALAAIGAYTAALLVMKAEWPFELAVLAGIASGGVFGALLGLLTVRVRTHYVLLVTIGFHVITLLLIINNSDLTGGPMGLYPVPSLRLGSFLFRSQESLFILYLLVTGVLLFMAERIRHSRFGLALFAIKNSERGAEALGINPAGFRIAAMVVGGVYAGTGGVMFAFLIKFLGPESFTIHSALLYILIVVLGGMGNNWGTVLAAVGLTILTEELKAIFEGWVLVYGILIMLIIGVAPGGIPELIVIVRRRFQSAPAPAAPRTSGGSPIQARNAPAVNDG